MSRRILVVEPDASSRAMLDRVLTAAGYATEDFESAYHATILLDDGAFDLAVLDEGAGLGAEALGEVRFVRERYPRVPLVVTGTMLTVPVLLELLRLGVEDALPKPYTPQDLRDAVARALPRAMPRRADALEYAAAVAVAREALAGGQPGAAARALARANAASPLDADVVSLEALRAELGGRDDDAARGYRASLALVRDEVLDGLDPHEGLARLGAYVDARPVAALPPRFRDAPLWLVTEPATELPSGPRELLANGPVVTVLALSLATPDAPGALYLRAGPGPQAFAILTTDLRPERSAALLARLGSGTLVPGPVSLAAGALDIARLASLRDGARAAVARDRLESEATG